MKTFTMKEFELKEDKIFDLAKQAFMLTPIDEDELAKRTPKEDKADINSQAS